MLSREICKKCSSSVILKQAFDSFATEYTADNWNSCFNHLWNKSETSLWCKRLEALCSAPCIGKKHSIPSLCPFQLEHILETQQAEKAKKEATISM